MTLTRYIARPATIEAVQWDGTTEAASELVLLATAGKVRFAGDDECEVRAGVDGSSGWLPIPVGTYVARNPGDPSDLWPLDPDVLARKYERAPEAG
jgi:hypothetical protein